MRIRTAAAEKNIVKFNANDILLLYPKAAIMITPITAAAKEIINLILYFFIFDILKPVKSP